MEIGNTDAKENLGTIGQQQLLKGCLHCLSQCDDLVQCISGADYTQSNAISSSIGGHMRHILERYQSLLTGLAGIKVDYDTRNRDREIEANTDAALFSIASIASRLTELELEEFGNTRIKVRETVHYLGEAVEVSSTVERELMSLITHSVHHLAIIKLLAQQFGHQLDDSFGKAPSTIVFERSQR